jgi:5'-deoxynucleotidase YfbR-like HD superfamily hydrolase
MHPKARRYYELTQKAGTKSLTPPEEVEYRELTSEFLEDAYSEVPDKVREELREYLEQPGDMPKEFFLGMMHSIQWISECLKESTMTETSVLMHLSMSVLSLAINDKIRDIQNTQAEKLNALLKLDTNNQ